MVTRQHGDDMEIRREKTAMARKKPSAPTCWAFDQDLLKSTVFDWGCGKGEDSRWLKEHGYKIVSYDPFFDNTSVPDRVNFKAINTILLVYVLNVIECGEERGGLLYDVGHMSKPGTTVVIAVPRKKHIADRAKKSKWKKLNDGFVTKSNTFQKGYTLGEFIDSCTLIGELKQVKKLSGSLVGVVEVKGLKNE